MTGDRPLLAKSYSVRESLKRSLMIMQQSRTTGTINRYMLQPGDGTRYEFFIVDLSEPGGTWTQLGDAKETWTGGWSPTIEGVGSGHDYVTIGICMPGVQGVYEMQREALKNLYPHHVEYLHSHMNLKRKQYTVAAVLLAASVLIHDPDDLTGACAAMLKVHELFAR